MEEEIPRRCTIEVWAPPVPAITEVFHAHIVDWAYPPHCHDTWAVLIVDDGAIRYDLDTRPRGAARRTVTILPPGVVHDGRPAPGATGFRKRELYLRADFLPAALTGAAVDRSNIADIRLWTALAGLHDCLARGGDLRDAEGRSPWSPSASPHTSPWPRGPWRWPPRSDSATRHTSPGTSNGIHR